MLIIVIIVISSSIELEWPTDILVTRGHKATQAEILDHSKQKLSVNDQRDHMENSIWN